jgi:carboxyl-terminal processing protease
MLARRHPGRRSKSDTHRQERCTHIKSRIALGAALVLSLGIAPSAVPAAAAPASATALSPRDANELLTSYAHLTTDYYKPVDRQAVLDGARTSIIAYLRASGIANPTLPSIHAAGDDPGNERELQQTVAQAVKRYAAKAGGKNGSGAGSTGITYAAISGELGSVKDKYTVFLSPKEFAEINESLDGTQFGGVGLAFDIDAKTKDIHVQNVIPDGPADHAGVLNEDLITEVNGQSIPALNAGKSNDRQTKRVNGLLRGVPGTKVSLTIDRDDKPQALTVTRATIHSPSVFARLLPSGIGWIQLSVFGADTGHELDTALHRLDAQGAKAFILDLRYNGGGYVNAAIDVSSKFIASGPIVTVQSRAGTDTEYDAENTAIAPRPLAVLVNHYSASASEITAGAIEDSGVGEIIGTRTYGKGVVQSVFPLGDGSALKITSARYLTPHGRDINSIGIEPQIVSDLPKNTRIKLGDPTSDVQLGAAITYLQSQIAARSAN